MNWRNALPWEDLQISPQDAPGWLARALISFARWLIGNLVPIALIVGIAVLFLAAAGLLVGVLDRDHALERLKRVSVALIVVALAATGVVITLAVGLARVLETGFKGG